MIAKLDEETLRKLRRQDLDSLKFGGTAVPIQQLLQGLPGALDKSINWMNKGRGWKKVKGKWVNENPLIINKVKDYLKNRKIESKAFTKEIRQNTQAAISRGEAKGKVTGQNIKQGINQNIAVPLKDALTDIVNMPTGKFDALGPASSRAYKLKTQGMGDIRGTSGDNYEAEEKRLGKRVEELGNEAALQKNLSIVNNNNTVNQIQPGKTFGGGLIASGNPTEMAAYKKAADWDFSKKAAAWGAKTRNTPAGKLMHAGKPVWTDAERYTKALHYKTNPQPWDRFFRLENQSAEALTKASKVKQGLGKNTAKGIQTPVKSTSLPKQGAITPGATGAGATATAAKGSNALGIASMIAAAVGGFLSAKQTVPGKAAENRSLGWVDPLPGGISGHYG